MHRHAHMCMHLVWQCSVIDKVLGILYFLGRVREEGIFRTVRRGYVHKALSEWHSKTLRVFKSTRTKDPLNWRERWGPVLGLRAQGLVNVTKSSGVGDHAGCSCVIDGVGMATTHQCHINKHCWLNVDKVPHNYSGRHPSPRGFHWVVDSN